MFPMSDESLVKYNTFLCHLLYLPLGLTFMIVFTIQNVVYMPLAYFKHTMALIQTLTDSDETMDEFDEKLRRFYTIIQFIFLGPFFLVISIPIDMVNFLINLYSKPAEKISDDIQTRITPKTLELFQECCTEALRQEKHHGPGRKSTKVSFVTLNRIL